MNEELEKRVKELEKQVADLLQRMDHTAEWEVNCECSLEALKKKIENIPIQDWESLEQLRMSVNSGSRTDNGGMVE